jgi:hypothetical protein
MVAFGWVALRDATARWLCVDAKCAAADSHPRRCSAGPSLRERFRWTFMQEGLCQHCSFEPVNRALFDATGSADSQAHRLAVQAQGEDWHLVDVLGR